MITDRFENVHGDENLVDIRPVDMDDRYRAAEDLDREEIWIDFIEGLIVNCPHAIGSYEWFKLAAAVARGYEDSIEKGAEEIAYNES